MTEKPVSEWPTLSALRRLVDLEVQLCPRCSHDNVLGIGLEKDTRRSAPGAEEARDDGMAEIRAAARAGLDEVPFYRGEEVVQELRVG